MDDNLQLTPGELRAIEDHMARYDIDIWLLTGRTDHFVTPSHIVYLPR